MIHHDHISKAFRARSCNRLRALAWAALAVLLSLASVPAVAQYEYRRSITVDRTKVRNPATLPIAFDALSSAKTADAGAASLSWSHTIGSGNDKIAIVSVSSKRGATSAVTFDAQSSSNTLGAVANTLTWNHTVGAAANRLAIVSIATRPAVIPEAFSSSNTGANTATTLSWTHTVGSLDNRILIVAVAINRNVAPNTQTVSGVTYNGLPLTFLGAAPNLTNCTAELWYLVAPPSGSFTVQVTISALARFVAGASSFFNVNQAAPLNFIAGINNVSPAAVNVTTGYDDYVVGVFGHVSSTPVWNSTGAGQLTRWTDVTTSGIATDNIKGYAGTLRAPSGTPTIPQFTISTGSNTQWSLAAAALRPAVATFQTVTFGGTDITANLIGSAVNSTNCAVYMYYMVNPTSGVNAVAVTLTTGSTGARFVAAATTYANVSQVAPVGAFVGNTGTGTTASLTVSSAANELVVDTLAQLSSTPTSTPNASQTQRWTNVTTFGTAAANIRGYGSTKPGAASTTMTWTITASTPWALGAVPVKPAAETIQTVTFGATNITGNRIGTALNTSNCELSMYYMLNPPAGTSTIAVTQSASVRFVAGVFSFFNVSQTTPFGTFASDTRSGNGGDYEIYTVSSAYGEIVVAALAKTYNNAVAQRAQNQQADRWNLWTSDATPANNILSIGTLRGGDTAAELQWDLAAGGPSGQQLAFGGVSVKPTTVAPPLITTLANYPLLVSLSDSTLKDTAHGGHIWNSNGWDIEFRASDGTTKLDHEIEKYDGTNGQVVAWVRLPSVNGAGAGSDTQIYICYGYKKISGPTQNKTAVWDANYMEVWHLAEPSGNATDSTSHNYVGTITNNPNVTRQAAKIDGGYHFGGSSYIVANDGTFGANAPLTTEAWFYLDSAPQTWVGIVTKNRDVTPCDAGPTPCDWAGIATGNSGELAYYWDWHTQGNLDTGPALSAATWYHAVLTFDGGIRTAYRNGARDTIVTAPNPSPGVYGSLTMPTRINQDMPASNIGTDIIDEVRISTVARTPGWILTTYDNMNNPGNIGAPGFYTVGNEDFLRFSYRRKITILDTMTPVSCGANLSNFPVLVSITDATLKSASNGGNIQSVNGYDIVFRATADDVTNLDHEIESYDGVNGTLVAWVRIPTLIYNAATTIYMYYGNPGVPSATANPAGVWNTANGWRGVWHMSEAAGATRNDSTVNANNLSLTGSVALGTGQIAGAASFNGTCTNFLSHADGGAGTSLDISGPLTVEAWVSMATTQTHTSNYIVNKWRGSCGSNTNPPYYLRVSSAAQVPPYSEFLQVENSCGPTTCVAPDCAGVGGGYGMNASTFYHIVGVSDGSTLTTYRNASVVGTPVAFTLGPWDSDGIFYVGVRDGNQQCFNGLIDEVRVSATGRDACWIGTEYNNESTPGTYVTVDPEQAVSAYAFRRPITIPDSMTPASCGANLPSFPVLVSITDATLKSASNGGNVQSINGYDIVFRAADGITVLDHEMETYVATSGQVVAWVRIPTLVYNAATTIYMYYGNAAITSATANPTGVWNTAYGWRGVWHMKENPAGIAPQMQDSTQNANHATSYGSMTAGQQVAGQVDGSLNFDGSNDYLQAPHQSYFQQAPFTAELWIRYTTLPSAGSHDVYNFSKEHSASPWQSWLIYTAYTGAAANKISFVLHDSGGGWQQIPANSAAVAGTWYHAVGTLDASYNMKLYINGVQQTATLNPGSMAASSNPLDFAGSSAGYGIAGIEDELRFSNIVRDACWVGTEYASMATPATVGAEAANAPTMVEMVSLDANEVPGRGVLVSWRTGFEVDNLGFHVYREVGGQRVRVTPSLVAGSALFAGAGTPLIAGRSYAWWDSSPVPGASYWLEEWELSGEKRWHGPVSVQPGAAQMQAQGLATAPSPLLSGFGQTVSPSPPQGVRRKLRQALTSSQDRLAVQWGLASRPAVKLLVSEEGWYRVSREELLAAGLDLDADPSTLQLYVDGRQVPIVVDVGGIEFYGEGFDTPSTAVRVYWLTVGLGEGLRIREAGGGGRWTPGPASFPSEVERVDRTLYFPGLLNGDEENFFGAVVTSTPVAQTVRVQHVDQADQAELLVRLQGGTAGAHRVGVELNGTRVGTVAWEGMQAGELSVPVGGHMILEGDNLVVLLADGGEGDVSTVESIRIRYAHTWEADREALKFNLGGYQEVTINGFAGAQVRVVDITDPGAVQALPVEVVKDGEAYQARVGVPEPGERTVLAVGTGAIRHPAGVLPNRPTAWHAAGQGADLLIIGHRSLLPALEPLRALRERQGLKVAVVDVESVYDEFSFGAKSPQAIRDFLACAKDSWSRPPRYLLLVGDASYDPRNYLGYGFLDLVPTKLVDTKYLETASDDWFADFDADGIADIPVGRIPVQTAIDAATVIGKIVAYEGAAASGRVLLVADANDKGNDFEGLTGQVKGVLPSSVTVAQVFRGQLWDAAESQLASQLNLGQAVVNYIGHGSNEVWHGNLLTTDAARTLHHDRLPVWLPMTCLNGYFQAPYGDSLAEALLKAPSGGAVAVWASSGLTESGDQLPMDEALVRLLFSGAPATLGDATLAAKAAAKDLDVRTTWIFFGDPTTTLRR